MNEQVNYAKIQRIQDNLEALTIGTFGTGFVTDAMMYESGIKATVAQHTSDLADKAKLDRTGTTLIARHKGLKSLLANKTASLATGLSLGDSICAGTGASQYGNIWGWKLGGKLQTWANSGIVADWATKNNGVGGQNILNLVNYISFDIGQVIPLKTTKSYAYNYKYWIIMTGRNDCVALSKDDFAYFYRLLVRMGIQNGIDVICCTEPPQLNMTTKEVVDGVTNSYPDYAQIIRDIASDEGASLVDIYQEFMYKKQIDGVDLTTLSSDGTHPNDAGHEAIAQMIYDCMMKTPVRLGSYIPYNEDFHNRCIPQQQFVHNSSTGTVTLDTISINSPSTARKEHLGICDAIHISSGGSVTLLIPPIKSDYIIVTAFDKISTGQMSIQCPTGLGILSGKTFSTSFISESSIVLKPTNTDYPAVNSITISATGGDIYLGGVTCICPALVSDHQKINGTEVGTWTDQYFATNQFRTSSTVGDTITIEWFGTNIMFNCGFAPDAGIIGINTDGLGETTYDLYRVSISELSFFGHIYPLTLGYHKTVITVKAKNVSSSGNRVGIRFVGVYSTQTKDNSVVAKVGTNINVYLNNPYNYIRNTVPYAITGNVLTASTNGLVETVMK